MRIEEFENLSEEDLRIKANEAFTKPELSYAANVDRATYFAEARFYLDEIEKRKNDRISRRDFRMELIVIFLIGLELIVAIGLAIIGGRQQSRDVERELRAFRDMQVVLSNLQDTSKATAGLLQGLETTNKEMNAHLLEQLGLNYEPAVAAVYDTSIGRIHLTNNSPTAISVYGYYVGDYDVKFPKPLVILPHGTEDLDNGPFYSQQKEKLHSTTANFPMVMFFRTKNGDEYTLNADLNIEALPTTGFFVRLVLVKVHREAWGYRLKGKKWN
jgi:hypothetical protein